MAHIVSTVLKNSLLNRFISQTGELQVITPFKFQINLNIIHPSTLRCPHWSFLFSVSEGISVRTCTYFLFVSGATFPVMLLNTLMIYLLIYAYVYFVKTSLRLSVIVSGLYSQLIW